MKNRKNDNMYSGIYRDYDNNNEILLNETFFNYNESRDKDDSIKNYYDNGFIKSEVDFIHKWKKEYYKTGKIEKDFGIYDNEWEIRAFYKEYYESGKLKAEIPTVISDGKSDLDKIKYYYSENGNVIKIELLDYNKVIETISDSKKIGEYVINKNTDKFNNVFIIKKLVQVSGGSYYAYEYPKGEVFYKKSLKVLEDAKKRFDSAESEEIRIQIVSEYDITVKKLILISEKDTKEINEKLSKVKKVDEIKAILGL